MESYDISRVANDPKKHYSSVCMQQGRVLTDDDWNENERIKIEERSRSRVDIIGGYGTQDNGFAIEFPMVGTDNFINFNICPGTVHLGGLRLELEKNELYRMQKDWLQQFADSGNNPLTLESGVWRYDLVYLEAWQQGVSAVEDNELLEYALGGLDTTTRIRTMRRVKILPDIRTTNCDEAFQVLKSRESRGDVRGNYEIVTDARLQISCIPTGVPNENLCAPSSIGGYLGAENQAIRVQLVDNSHFTWGYDNAAPLYRVEVKFDPIGSPATLKVVKMLIEPKDQHHWPMANQIVEILPWSAVLSNGEKIAGQCGHLSRVQSSYNPDSGEFTLVTPIDSDFGVAWKERKDAALLTAPVANACPAGNPETREYFYMRVWNRGNDISSPPAIPFTPGSPAPLANTGLQITISGGPLNKGDFWVVAARPETPSQIVPWSMATGKSPNGIRRFVAPLAIIRWIHTGLRIKGKVIKDCRKYFPPLNNIWAKDIKFNNGTCDFSHPEAKTAQEAIDNICKRQKCTLVAVPGNGWQNIFHRIQEGQDAHVCFQLGTYVLEHAVILRNKGNITFSGCGKGTLIIVKNTESAFAFIECGDIVINGLSVKSEAIGRRSKYKHLNGAIVIQDCQNAFVENVNLSCADSSIRSASCLTVRNTTTQINNSAIVRNSRFNIGNYQVGILIVNADRTHIETNQVVSLEKARGNQGIVVGGSRLKEVHIRDNSVKQVIQGIHIGASHKEPDQGTPDMAGTVIISGNNIACFLPNDYKFERHGIFVGNCNSLVVSENFISLTTPDKSRILNIQGIRVYGHFGKRIIVKNNQLENFRSRYGILMEALNSSQLPRPVWIVEQNVASVQVSSSKFIRRENFA